MKISVIIPTMNESSTLRRTVSRVREAARPESIEVIVVDASSQDDTEILARTLADKVVVSRQAGRAIQLHQGALAATGDIFLFLHADSRLPETWQLSVETALLSKNPPVATAFRKKFDHSSFLYKFIGWGSRLRSRVTGIPHGDQAMAVLKDRYFQVGGFPPVPLMEEYYFGRTLRRFGRIQFLKDIIVVSARRYEKNGPLFHAFRNTVIVFLHYLGVSSARLKKLYEGRSLKVLSQFLILALLSCPPVFSFDQSHALLDRILRQYNHQGRVDYQGLKTDPDDLNHYLEELADTSSAQYEKWTPEEKIAFWINAYNAFTLKAVIDHYPIKSIRQINGVWEKSIYSAAGQTVSLNHIENQILRKKFNKPRIHMALVCASRGCPPLNEKAIIGSKLDQQLKEQTLLYLSNPNNFRIDKESGKVYLSSVFDWFGDDFIKTHAPSSGFGKRPLKEKAVLNFTCGHVNSKDQEFLKSGQYEVKYLTYDWSLNERRP